jgi:hypothetical protein
MTVYVICEPSDRRDGTPAYDVSPAAVYGPIKYIIPRGHPSPSRDTDAALVTIDEELAAFNACSDYILWAGGDPLAAVLVGHVLSDVSSYTYLRWEKNPTSIGGNYVPVTVDIL